MSREEEIEKRLAEIGPFIPGDANLDDEPIRSGAINSEAARLEGELQGLRAKAA